MRNFLYIAVTADKLEIPVACAESISELARLVGKSYSSISSSISKAHSGRRNGFRVIKVILDKDSE